MARSKKNGSTRAAPGPRYIHAATTRVDGATKGWLDGLAVSYGMKDADILRRIIEDAQINGWNPAASMAGRAGATT